MTNGDLVRQMTDDELVNFIKDEPWCGDNCQYDMDCDSCLDSFITSFDKTDILESRRDGFFDCNMKNCTYAIRGKCTNPCYLDCPFYSLRQSLRELISGYEKIVTKI